VAAAATSLAVEKTLNQLAPLVFIDMTKASLRAYGHTQSVVF
jgi:hypothetical protein